MKKNRKITKLAVAILTFAMVLGLCSCGSSKTEEKETNTGIESIKGFETKDIYGEKVTSDLLKENDLTMVNVMSSTCNPCMGELPDLMSLSEEYKGKKIGFMGINIDMDTDGNPDKNSAAAIKKVIKGKKGSMKIVFPDNVLLEKVLTNVDALPFTFFVDKEGNVVGESHLGSQTKDEWKTFIDKELK